jgi:hypothetical protein
VPRPRILIIGATHIGQMLAQLVTLAGYEVAVIDPRTAFAAEARFPGIRLDTEWPQDAIPKVGLDPYTAVVALAHVGHIDDEALKLAMRSECFYVGALGSRRNHAKRTERLQAAGFSAEEIARIHSPIGINIGAQNPQEIAISIMAEIVLACADPNSGGRQRRHATDISYGPRRVARLAQGEDHAGSLHLRWTAHALRTPRRQPGPRAAGRSAGRRREGGGGALGLLDRHHRRRVDRLRLASGRRQPQRRPSRAAAGRPADRDARHGAQPAVRLGIERAGRRGARHHLRRGRRVRRRWRREHDARAVRGGQAEQPFTKNFTVFDSSLGARFPNPKIESLFGADTMPETSDNLARDYQLSREECDLFALGSQQKYAKGHKDGFFNSEIKAGLDPAAEGQAGRGGRGRRASAPDTTWTAC